MTIRTRMLRFSSLLSTGLLLSIISSQHSFCLPVGDRHDSNSSSSEVELPEFRMMHPGDSLELKSKPHQISLGLAWDPPLDETYVDIDLNLHVIKRSRKIASSVWYHKKKYRSSWLFGRIPCIEHTNDSITGDGHGDNERILVNFRNLSLFRPRVTHLVVSLTCYSKHWIHELDQAVLRLCVLGKNGKSTEIAGLRLSDCHAAPKKGSERGGKATLLLSMTKGKHGIWTIKILGNSIKTEDCERAAIAQDCNPHIIKLLKAGDLDI